MAVWKWLSERSRAAGRWLHVTTALTPNEAQVRFGELTVPVGVGALRVHQVFEDRDGLWRPVFDEAMRLESYRLYPKLQVEPGASYRPKW